MATIIPEDVFEPILRRLPSKSIGQFRCVSKKWLSLLTDPHFIQTHQKTLNTNRFIFEQSNDTQPPKTTLYNKNHIIIDGTPKDGLFCSVPYNKPEAMSTTIINLPLELYNLCIYGSVSGLVLASGYKTMPHKDFTYFVLNPTTKDYVELPSSLYNQLFGNIGFGYDSVSGDYKVVVFSRYEPYDRDVYIYNITTNTMKLVLTKSPYGDCHFGMSSGVFVNGFLHWIFYHRSTQQFVIVAVSLADEKLTELPPPSQVDLSDLYTKLVSLGDDKLAIFNQVKGDIWVMNEYGVQKSWTKIVVNGFNQLNKPIVFSDNSKLVFLTGNRLWIYHVEEGTFSQSVDISYMKIKYFVGAYAETLVSPPKFSLTSE